MNSVSVAIKCRAKALTVVFRSGGNACELLIAFNINVGGHLEKIAVVGLQRSVGLRAKLNQVGLRFNQIRTRLRAFPIPCFRSEN